MSQHQRGRRGQRDRGRRDASRNSRTPERSPPGRSSYRNHEEDRMVDLIQRTVRQSLEQHRRENTAASAGRHTTYHQQMEEMRERVAKIDDEFWSPGEPWSYRSERFEMCGDFVAQVRIVMAERTWQEGMPVALSKPLQTWADSVKPPRRTEDLTDLLNAATAEFRTTIRAIVRDHLVSAREENSKKLRSYGDNIRQRAKQAAMTRLANQYGRRTPTDMEVIMDEPWRDRTQPPGMAPMLPPIRRPDDEADADNIKRLRLSIEQGAAGGSA